MQIIRKIKKKQTDVSLTCYLKIRNVCSCATRNNIVRAVRFGNVMIFSGCFWTVINPSRFLITMLCENEKSAQYKKGMDTSWRIRASAQHAWRAACLYGCWSRLRNRLDIPPWCSSWHIDMSLAARTQYSSNTIPRNMPNSNYAITSSDLTFISVAN